MTKTHLKTFIIVVYFLFALVRFLSAYRSDIGFDLYDSPSYFNPTWTNPIRMPFLTYLYTFLANYSAIALFQTILSTFSWILLSYALYSIINNPLIKLVSIILVLSLGMTPPIVGFDLVILTESLTFSIFNCIIALMILYYKSKKNLQLLFLLFFIIFYAGTKQTSAHISIVLVLLILVFILSNFKTINNINLQIILVVGSIFISSFFIWLARQNSLISSQVEITNIIERTFNDYDSQKWYLDQGFPGIAYQQYSAKPSEPPIGPTRSLPQVKAWELFEKKSPIERFAISHPLFLIFGPLTPSSFIPTFTENESAIVSLARGRPLDESYSLINLRTLEREPFFLANLNLPSFFWWSESKIIQKLSLVIFLTIILFFYATPYLKRFRIDQTSNNLVSHLLIVFFAGVWSNWHISVTYELDRYLMPWAIALRVIFIMALALTLDSYFKRKSNQSFPKANRLT
jgi:hypothetical protein